MPAASYRFGPFFVDRTAYCVLKDDDALTLTPKLLDLLFHLLDHSGTLVTKEELLDALWPGANVTDNAGAGDVELRQALGDDAGAPQFIKTVARRGYRFIAAVQTLASGPSDVQPAAGSAAAGHHAPSDDRTIAVMDFVNVTGDADSAWLSAGISGKTVTGDLSALGHFRVVDRRRASWRLRAARADRCSRWRPTLARGSPSSGAFSVRGPSDPYHVPRHRRRQRRGSPTPRSTVRSMRSSTCRGSRWSGGFRVTRLAGFGNERRRRGAWKRRSRSAPRLQRRSGCDPIARRFAQMGQAIADFGRAVAADSRYALAYTGLATAELARYEMTRSDNEPAQDLLERAVQHARHAVQLDDGLGEAHSTLALVLVSLWQTDAAAASARRAVALEPSNWRHLFRLGHASWGEPRLPEAAGSTLAIVPGLRVYVFPNRDGPRGPAASAGRRGRAASRRRGTGPADRARRTVSRTRIALAARPRPAGTG